MTPTPGDHECSNEIKENNEKNTCTGRGAPEGSWSYQWKTTMKTKIKSPGPI